MITFKQLHQIVFSRSTTQSVVEVIEMITLPTKDRFALGIDQRFEGENEETICKDVHVMDLNEIESYEPSLELTRDESSTCSFSEEGYVKKTIGGTDSLTESFELPSSDIHRMNSIVCNSFGDRVHSAEKLTSHSRKKLSRKKRHKYDLQDHVARMKRARSMAKKKDLNLWRKYGSLMTLPTKDVTAYGIDQFFEGKNEELLCEYTHEMDLKEKESSDRSACNVSDEGCVQNSIDGIVHLTESVESYSSDGDHVDSIVSDSFGDHDHSTANHFRRSRENLQRKKLQKHDLREHVTRLKRARNLAKKRDLNIWRKIGSLN
jgi:hypothetical protein